MGAEISLPEGHSPETLLFGEYQSRVLVTLEEKDLPVLQKIGKKHSVKPWYLGRVGGSQLKISLGTHMVVQKEVAEMEKVWKNAITCFLVN